MALDGDGHMIDHLKAERRNLIEDITELLNRQMKTAKFQKMTK